MLSISWLFFYLLLSSFTCLFRLCWLDLCLVTCEHSGKGVSISNYCISLHDAIQEPSASENDKVLWKYVYKPHDPSAIHDDSVLSCTSFWQYYCLSIVWNCVVISNYLMLISLVTHIIFVTVFVLNAIMRLLPINFLKVSLFNIE